MLAECGPAWTCGVRERRRWSGSWGERDLGGDTGAERGAEEGRGLRRGRPARLRGPSPTLMPSPVGSRLPAEQHTCCAPGPRAWYPGAHFAQDNGGPASSRAGRLCPCRRPCLPRDTVSPASVRARRRSQSGLAQPPPPPLIPYPGGLRASGRGGQVRPLPPLQLGTHRIRTAAVPKTIRRKASLLMAGACARP